jgi:hypothetical protein
MTIRRLSPICSSGLKFVPAGYRINLQSRHPRMISKIYDSKLFFVFFIDKAKYHKRNDLRFGFTHVILFTMYTGNEYYR